MTKVRPPGHKHDVQALFAVLVFGLILAWYTAFHRLREIHKHNEAVLSAQFREAAEGDDDDWVFACSPELHSFCAGRHHQLECLKENQAALSARCVSHIRTYETTDQWRRACYEDAVRLCSETSEGRSKACLAQHAQELSASCRIYYSSPHADIQ